MIHFLSCPKSLVAKSHFLQLSKQWPAVTLSPLSAATQFTKSELSREERQFPSNPHTRARVYAYIELLCYILDFRIGICSCHFLDVFIKLPRCKTRGSKTNTAVGRNIIWLIYKSALSVKRVCPSGPLFANFVLTGNTHYGVIARFENNLS